MDRVLDLDLDFFVWPVIREPPETGRLPDSECERLATAEEARTFMQERCGLAPTSKIRGREFSQHVEAFCTWRDWMKEGQLSAPFDVFHIDGHADLGAGYNLSLAYLDELLALPLPDRSNIRFGNQGLNSGNYLLGALANRWIHSLTFVYPTAPISAEPAPPMDPATARRQEIMQFLTDGLGQAPGPPVRDLPPSCFRDNDWRTKEIQLKGYKTEDYRRPHPVPACLEPCVHFELVADRDFKSHGFTHMVVAQSPQYTPGTADLLLGIIREYFAPD